MAERSAGGWLSRAAGEAASTRPAASATDTISAGRASKAAITRAWASRTVSITSSSGARTSRSAHAHDADLEVRAPMTRYAFHVPDLPPDLCNSRTSEITMPRSTDLHM